MTDLFTQMRVFAPNSVRVIVDIEVETRVDYISADLITTSSEDDETVIIPHRIKHADFEAHLLDYGHLTPEITLDTSDTVTGAHVQETWVENLDYSEYLTHHLDKAHVYEYLKAAGKTTLKYQPE